MATFYRWIINFTALIMVLLAFFFAYMGLKDGGIASIIGGIIGIFSYILYKLFFEEKFLRMRKKLFQKFKR
jgi:protein-S-isoprenylcysteine O-methyltransferase Ste14